MFAPACGSRVRARNEQENGQPDVPEHEAEEAPGERDEKAPDADRREDQCVHSLEYGP